MARLSKTLRSKPVVALGLASLISAAVLGVRAAGWLEGLELEAYDRLLAQRPQPAAPGARVAVVGFTERDIMEQGVYPIPDATLTRALEAVLAGGPRAVGVDFHRDVLIPPGSEQLEALLLRDRRIVMIEMLARENAPAVPPPRVLVGSDQVGFSDFPLDDDDTLRRAALYLDDEAGTVFSLALQAAMRWLAPEGRQLGLDPEDESRIALGPTPLPRFQGRDGGYAGSDDSGYQILIDFDGSEPYPAISLHELLSGELPPDTFRDKMVFVGAVAETIADLRRTPFGLWPGVFVHGHVAAQLARYGMGEDRPIASLPEPLEVAWVVLWALLGAGLALLNASAWVVLGALAAGALTLAAASYVPLLFDWWIPSVPPTLAWIFSATAVTGYISRSERLELAALMQLFSRYASQEVAKELWEHRDEFVEEGRPKPSRQGVTVLFVDVKNFTPVAEALGPLEVTEWVNELMGMLADETERHGGFVDDYFGDGMKADFGVPLPRLTEEAQDADAVAAVRCAMEMERRLHELNQSWRERGMPIGALRVGINSGQAVAVSIGSAAKLKYTVVGDTVNTAARIESLDDSQHDFEKKRVRVLVSEDTLGRLGDAFATRLLGEFPLKGKKVRVRIHEVLGAAEAQGAEGAAAGA